jgi:hypothetical protein
MSNVSIAKQKPRYKLHKILLSVISSVIVLITFVVNEGLRAKASESANSVNRASESFLVISTGLSNAPKIDRIQEEIAEIQTSLASSTPGARLHPASEKIPLGALEWQAAAYKNFQDALDNEKRLVQAAHLQSDSEYSGKLRSIQDDLEKDSRYLRTAFRFNSAVDQKNAQQTSELRGQLQSLATKEAPGNYRFRPTDAEIAKEIDSLGSYLLKQAEDERVAAEKLAKQWTVASYFLYPLGVGLALVGKLIGDDGGVIGGE